jgi:hypothetical protein
MNKTIDKYNENNIENLTNLTNAEIRKLTPYLNDLKEKLTPKQRKFCFFYVMNGLDSLKACRMAGYSEKRIYVTNHYNKRDSKLNEAIDLIIKNEIKLTKKQLEINIFNRFMAVLDYDILDYMEEDGTVKGKLSDIPKPIRKLITKVETKWYGKDAQRKVITLEFLGREWAINQMMKYSGMLKEDTDKTNVTINIQQELADMLNGKGK